MAFLQLRVHTTKPEFAEEILLAHGASAVSFVDAQDDPILEPAPGETPLWAETITVGLFAEDTDLASVIDSLRDVLPETSTLRTQTELVEDQEWIRAWLKDCPPLQFGERLWVVPHERADEVRDPGAIVVKLDPGLAFGTGTHPSTALCLGWLASHDLRDATVVDFGCGSGILAIAALKLGASRAVCTDIDPQALLAAGQNAEANDVAGRLTTVAAADFVPFAADVVLANILANPLISLASLLASSVKPNGRVVLAGLLDSQADDVRAAYERWFTFEADRRVDGWTLLVGRCHNPAMIRELALAPRLRTSGQPQPHHFSALAADGVEAVINLALPTSPNALADEEERVRGLGMEYTHIPVKWEAPADSDLQKFFARMEELRGRSVLVHCALNLRVSAFMFLWRVLREGISLDAALRDLHHVWHPNETWRNFIERTLEHHQVKLPRAKKISEK